MPVRILHLHSTFDLGGKEARAVRLMNAFGKAATHTIVSGVEGAYGARDAIANGVRYEIAQDPPALTGRPSVGRYEAIARYMRRFDLVLTYNWGAIDGVMAKRAFAKGAPPLVHHEDGFNADEAIRLKSTRNGFRRVALAAAHALVVPSVTLERIAAKAWAQPAARVRRIPNGIPVTRYAVPPRPDAIPGFRRAEGDIVIGTLAGMRPVKNLPALVRAVGGVARDVRLVIVGEGPERPEIEAAVRAMGLSDRVTLPGFLPDPHRFVGLFDIMALSSLSEQFPIAVVEGMAAGLPIAGAAVGDIPEMVSEANRPYLAQENSEVWLRDSLNYFVENPEWRAAVGGHNRHKAAAEFDEGVMIARYKALYEEALGKPGALG